MGIIQLFSASLGVDVPTATHAITAYAIGVVIAAPSLTLFGARLNRRTLLLLLLIGIFILGNLLSAVADGLGMFVVARFITGLPQAGAVRCEDDGGNPDDPGAPHRPRPGIKDTDGAMNLASLNVANAPGAWAGGVTIGAGLGLLSAVWAGFALTAAGLLLFLGTMTARSRRDVVAKLG